MGGGGARPWLVDDDSHVEPLVLVEDLGPAVELGRVAARHAHPHRKAVGEGTSIHLQWTPKHAHPGHEPRHRPHALGKPRDRHPRLLEDHSRRRIRIREPDGRLQVVERQEDPATPHTHLEEVPGGETHRELEGMWLYQLLGKE